MHLVAALPLPFFSAELLLHETAVLKIISYAPTGIEGKKEKGEERKQEPFMQATPNPYLVWSNTEGVRIKFGLHLIYTYTYQIRVYCTWTGKIHSKNMSQGSCKV